MEIENWRITYYMQTRTGIIKLEEPLKIKAGYHDALRRFWLKNEFEEKKKDPIYKTKRGNYVELLSLGFAGGFTLPLTPKKDLEKAVLLCDSEHTVKLTAPDGTEYRHSK